MPDADPPGNGSGHEASDDPGAGRLGLRARVTLLFALGAFGLSLMMGGLSYFTARHFLVNERQSASYHQAYLDATQVRTRLFDPDGDEVLGAATIAPLMPYHNRRRPITSNAPVPV